MGRTDALGGAPSGTPGWPPAPSDTSSTPPGVEGRGGTPAAPGGSEARGPGSVGTAEAPGTTDTTGTTGVGGVQSTDVYETGEARGTTGARATAPGAAPAHAAGQTTPTDARPSDDAFRSARDTYRDAAAAYTAASPAPTPEQVRAFQEAEQVLGVMLNGYAEHIAALPETERGAEVTRLRGMSDEITPVANRARTAELMRANDPGPAGARGERAVQPLATILPNIALGMEDAAGTPHRAPPPPGFQYFAWGRAMQMRGVTREELETFVATGQMSERMQGIVQNAERTGGWTDLNAMQGFMHAGIASCRARVGQLTTRKTELEADLQRVESTQPVDEARRTRLQTDLRSTEEQLTHFNGRIEQETAMMRGIVNGSSGAREAQGHGLASAGARDLGRASELERRVASGELTGGAADRARAEAGRLRTRGDSLARRGARALEAEGAHRARMADGAREGSSTRAYFQRLSSQAYDGAASAQTTRGRASLDASALPTGGTRLTEMPAALGDQPASGNEPAGALLLVRRAEEVNPGALSDPDHLATRADVHRTRRDFYSQRTVSTGYRTEPRPGEPAPLPSAQAIEARRGYLGESAVLLSVVDENIRILQSSTTTTSGESVHLARLQTESRDLHRERAEVDAAATVATQADTSTRAALESTRVQRDGGRLDGQDIPSIDTQLTGLATRRTDLETQLRECSTDETERRDSINASIADVDTDRRLLEHRRSELTTGVTSLTQQAAVTGREVTLAGNDRTYMLEAGRGPDLFGRTTADSSMGAEESLRVSDARAREATASYRVAVSRSEGLPLPEQAQLAAEVARFSYGNAEYFGRAAELTGVGATPTPPPLPTDHSPAAEAHRASEQTRGARLDAAEENLGRGERARHNFARPEVREALGPNADHTVRELRDSSVRAHAHVGSAMARTDGMRGMAILNTGHSVLTTEVWPAANTDALRLSANRLTGELAQSVGDAREFLASRPGGGVRWEGEGADRHPVPDADTTQGMYSLEQRVATAFRVPDAEMSTFRGLEPPLDWNNPAHREQIIARFPNVAAALPAGIRISEQEARFASMSRLLDASDVALREAHFRGGHELEEMRFQLHDANDLAISDTINGLSWIGAKAVNGVASLVGSSARSTTLEGLADAQEDLNVAQANGRLSTERLHGTMALHAVRDAWTQATPGEGRADQRYVLLGAMQYSAMTPTERSRALGITPAQADGVGSRYMRDTAHLFSDARTPRSLRDQGLNAQTLALSTFRMEVRNADGTTRTESFNYPASIAPLGDYLRSPGADPRGFVPPLMNPNDPESYLVGPANMPVMRANIESFGRYTRDTQDLARKFGYVAMACDIGLALVPIPGMQAGAVRIPFALARAARAFEAAAVTYRAGRVLFTGARIVAESRAVVAAGRGLSVAGRGLRVVSTAVREQRAVAATARYLASGTRGARFLGGAAHMAMIQGATMGSIELSAHTLGRRHPFTKTLGVMANFVNFGQAAQVSGLRNFAAQLAMAEGIGLAPTILMDEANARGWARIDPRTQFWANFAIGVFVPAGIGAAGRHPGGPMPVSEQTTVLAEHLMPPPPEGSSPQVMRRWEQRQTRLRSDLDGALRDFGSEAAPTSEGFRAQQERLGDILRRHEIPTEVADGILRGRASGRAFAEAIRERGGLETPPNPVETRAMVDRVAADLVAQGVPARDAYQLAGMQVAEGLTAAGRNAAHASNNPAAADPYYSAHEIAADHATASAMLDAHRLPEGVRERSTEALTGAMARHRASAEVRSDPRGYLRELNLALEQAGVLPRERAGLLLMETERIASDGMHRRLDAVQQAGVEVTPEVRLRAATEEARQILGADADGAHIREMAEHLAGVREGAAPTGVPDRIAGASPEAVAQADRALGVAEETAGRMREAAPRMAMQVEGPVRDVLARMIERGEINVPPEAFGIDPGLGGDPRHVAFREGRAEMLARQDAPALVGQNADITGARGVSSEIVRIVSPEGEYFFKPGSARNGDRPRREVLASRVDGLFDLGIIPETNLRTVDGVVGSAQRRVPPEFQQGNPINAGALIEDPRFASGMADLRALDYILASGDRHPGNLFMDPQTGRVMAIDNEGALSTVLPPSMRRMYPLSGGILPDAYTPRMREALARLTPEVIRERIGDLASPTEIEGMLLRLEVVRAHAEHAPTVMSDGTLLHADGGVQRPGGARVPAAEVITEPSGIRYLPDGTSIGGDGTVRAPLPAGDVPAQQRTGAARQTGPDPRWDAPDAEALAGARRAVAGGYRLSSGEAAVLLTDVSVAAREALVTGQTRPVPRDQVFAAERIGGACGFGQAATAFRLVDLGIPADRVHIHQAADLFGDGGQRHAFTTVDMPDGRRYLVDTTFRQFTVDIPPNLRNADGSPNPAALGAPGEILRRTAEGRRIIDELGHQGFIELTPAVARLYGEALSGGTAARPMRPADYFTADSSMPNRMPTERGGSGRIDFDREEIPMRELPPLGEGAPVREGGGVSRGVESPNARGPPEGRGLPDDAAAATVPAPNSPLDSAAAAATVRRTNPLDPEAAVETVRRTNPLDPEAAVETVRRTNPLDPEAAVETVPRSRSLGADAALATEPTVRPLDPDAAAATVPAPNRPMPPEAVPGTPAVRPGEVTGGARSVGLESFQASRHRQFAELATGVPANVVDGWFGTAGGRVRDTLTGFETGEARAPTVDAARDLVRADPSASAFYVEADVRNLSGLNGNLGPAQADAVYRNMSEVVQRHLQAVGADVQSFRHGGDEISFVVAGQGVDRATLDAAIARAQAEIGRYVASTSMPRADANNLPVLGADGQPQVIRLADIVHPKHSEQRAFDGTGMAVGIAEITPSRSTDATFNAAGAEVEAAKIAAGLVDHSPQAPLAPGSFLDAGAVTTHAVPPAARRTPDVTAPPGREPFVGGMEARRRAFVAQVVRESGGRVPAARATEMFRLARGERLDHVTGFSSVGDRGPTIDAAAAQVAARPGERAYYVSGEVLNLGGLNAVLGHQGADAVFNNASQIVAQELRAVGADLAPFRTGGPEVGFVIVGRGVSPEHIQAALGRAQTRMEAYARDTVVTTSDGTPHRLADIAHPKHRADARRVGVGVALSMVEIPPARAGSTESVSGGIVQRAEAGRRAQVEARFDGPPTVERGRQMVDTTRAGDPGLSGSVRFAADIPGATPGIYDAPTRGPARFASYTYTTGDGATGYRIATGESMQLTVPADGRVALRTTDFYSCAACVIRGRNAAGETVLFVGHLEAGHETGQMTRLAADVERLRAAGVRDLEVVVQIDPSARGPVDPNGWPADFYSFPRTDAEVRAALGPDVARLQVMERPLDARGEPMRTDLTVTPEGIVFETPDLAAGQRLQTVRFGGSEPTVSGAAVVSADPRLPAEGTTGRAGRAGRAPEAPSGPAAGRPVALRTLASDAPGAAPRQIHAGAQGKHVPGHPNYQPGKSIFSHPDAQGLIDRFAGRGTAVAGEPGRPGYRERVDFGEPIGEYVDPVTRVATPTSMGIIHYSGRGMHIVPARPQ